MSTEVAPSGISDVVTPSGLEIHYEAAPKRLYKIRQIPEIEPGIFVYDHILDSNNTDWREVPSVSTITDVISKPLQWWGMRVGVEGVQALYRKYEDADMVLERDVDTVVQMLTEHNLTVNHNWDATNRATNRGTNVHKALEFFADTSINPNPDFYPENERGYVSGLVAFLRDSGAAPVMSEVMVASLDGYAGRFDLVCNLDGEVVTKLYPKKSPVRTQPSGSWLIDLKTSSGVWPSYHCQVAGYLHALEECGYPVPDHAGMLRVTNDGRYELVECEATYEDFLNALSLYSSVKRIGK